MRKAKKNPYSNKVYRPVSVKDASMIAGGSSVLIHLLLLLLAHSVLVGFGSPVVDPYNPPAMINVQTKIDPKSLMESPQPYKGPNRADSYKPIQIEPDSIVAFQGPIDAPRIPTPRVVSEEPIPLSAEASRVPIKAFSALDLEALGNTPQLSQALVGDASTAALEEVNTALTQANLPGGTAAQHSTIGTPGIEKLNELVTFQTDVPDRPPIRPILLRLSSDVLFKFDSAELLPEAEKSLHQVAYLLKQAVRVVVTIEGHTDTIGEASYNQTLSELRAQAVADWMITTTSMNPHSFHVRGYGESKPLGNVDGDKDEQKRNRRVEIRIEGER